MAFDYKKEYKDLYCPGTKPAIVDVPEMKFFMVSGQGDPNTSPAYREALEILYGLSYGVKMSKMNGTQPEGYFDYVVPPLEGLWWTEGETFDGVNVKDKDRFQWVSMIRQPDFVTEEVYGRVLEALRKKKPELDCSALCFRTWTEGLCAQLLHKGPYDTEFESVAKLERYVREAGYEPDFSDKRLHHEIYLGDPRRTKPENLRTVIRHPVRVREA